MLLIRHNQSLLLDIRVCRPTCNTEIAHNAKVNIEPLVTAKAHERQKHRHYDAECALHQWQLIPVVFETYGGMGKEGQKLLAMLADACDTLTSQQFLTHARAVLSVALQSGHGRVRQQGMTSWATRQLHAASTTAASRRQLPSIHAQRRQMQSLAQRGDSSATMIL